MKITFLLFLLFPMALCVKAQTTVTLNLPNACLITGVDDGQTFEVSVFPNPGSNQFQLSIKGNDPIGKAMIKLFTAQGAMVFSEQIYSENKTVIKTINTETLSSGLYVVSVQGKKFSHTKRIVLNK